jgi:hypothetical protein
MALGESVPFHTAHVFENVLLGVLGAEGYKGLWTGVTPFSDPGVTESLTTLDRMIGFANPDYLSIDSVGAIDLVIAGRAASIIDGDWTNGYLKSKKFADFGYSPSPQTQGVYNALADSFGLPKNTVDRDNAICGSRSAVRWPPDAFNPLKGSIPARIDGARPVRPYQRRRSQTSRATSSCRASCTVLGHSFVTDFVNILKPCGQRRRGDPDASGSGRSGSRVCLRQDCIQQRGPTLSALVHLLRRQSGGRLVPG